MRHRRRLLGERRPRSSLAPSPAPAPPGPCAGARRRPLPHTAASRGPGSPSGSTAVHGLAAPPTGLPRAAAPQVLPRTRACAPSPGSTCARAPRLLPRASLARTARSSAACAASCSSAPALRPLQRACAAAACTLRRAWWRRGREAGEDPRGRGAAGGEKRKDARERKNREGREIEFPKDLC
jgi:hypothetical protein